MANHSASSKSSSLRSSTQQGFTYLALLFAIAIAGISLSVTSEIWVKQSEREHKAQADWIGTQYEDAIASFFYSSLSSNGLRVYPRSVDDLLEDKRFTPPRRHLRQAYLSSLPSGHRIAMARLATGEISGIEVFDSEERLVCSHFFQQTTPTLSR